MLLPLLVASGTAAAVWQESTCKNGPDSSCVAPTDESLIEDSLSMLQTSMHVSPTMPTHSQSPVSAMASWLGDPDCAPLTQHTSIRDRTAGKRVLIATPLKDASKRLREYADSIARLSYEKSLLSVAFLVSDSHDDTAALAAEIATQSLAEFASVSIIFQNFNHAASGNRKETEAVHPHGARHAYEAQAARRAILAKSRNALLNHSLTQDIDYVFWLDVDVTGFPSTILQDLLAVGRPIVAPHVLIGDVTYDKNSWRERFPHKTESGIAAVYFETYKVQESGYRDHMDFLLKAAKKRGIQDWRYAVKLDGVGTAALLVDAKLHREAGLLFPEIPYKHRLESEGFGLLARDHGFQACGLPLYKVHHYDEWEVEKLLIPLVSKKEEKKKAEMIEKAEKAQKAKKIEKEKMQKTKKLEKEVAEGVREALGAPPLEHLRASLGGVYP